MLQLLDLVFLPALCRDLFRAEFLRVITVISCLNLEYHYFLVSLARQKNLGELAAIE